MPRITMDLTDRQRLLFCTVRVSAVGEDGRRWCGTAFAFETHTPIGRGPTLVNYLVTNRHIVEGAPVGTLEFMRRKGRGLDLDSPLQWRVSDFGSRWVRHPDPNIDLAIMPLDPVLEDAKSAGHNPFVLALPQEMIPSTLDWTRIDAIEQVLFIGYPAGLTDSASGIPIMRRGITATPPCIDFDRKPQFLIDASVFGGSSGSPVFLYHEGLRPDFFGRVTMSSGPSHLLGVLAEYQYQMEEGEIVRKPAPAAFEGHVVRTPQMLDLGVVFRSELILEVVRPLHYTEEERTKMLPIPRPRG